mgnify:CR=1 FL=1
MQESGQDAGQHRRRCCEAADGTRRGRGQGALLEPLVLAALAHSETHGYDLARTMEEMTGGEVVPDAGGLYRILRRLEADGVVTSAWQEGDSGPQRRAYRLTEDGRRLLSHWIGHLEERRRTLDVLIDAVRQSSETV